MEYKMREDGTAGVPSSLFFYILSKRKEEGRTDLALSSMFPYRISYISSVAVPSISIKVATNSKELFSLLWTSRGTSK